MGLVAHDGFEIEGLGEIVAEGVACVGAGAVGFVDVVEGPGDVFEILNEFTASGVDEQVCFAELVAQTAIDAVDTVAHGGVDGDGVEFCIVRSFPESEELTDESPIGIGARGAALIAAGVAVDFDFERALMVGHGLGQLESAFVKGLAGGFGVGGGFNDDLFENVNGVGDALHKEHTHGIDVEIERPDERMQIFKAEFANVSGAIKGVVDAIEVMGGESGFKFLAVGFRIELAGGTHEFVVSDEAALGGGELKGLPIGISFGEFELGEEVIVAFGSADEEGAAFPVGKRGAEDFVPGFGAMGGEFIHDEEIDARTAEGIGIEGAGDEESGVPGEIDAELGFVGAFGTQVAGEEFEAVPGDAFGLLIVGADVPNDAIALAGFAEHFGEGEIGFAEAAAGDEDAETGGGMKDFELARVQRDHKGIGGGVAFRHRRKSDGGSTLTVGEFFMPRGFLRSR